jgi:uncharacterized protein (DUF342 family)
MESNQEKSTEPSKSAVANPSAQALSPKNEYNLDRGMNIEVSKDQLEAFLLVRPNWLLGKEVSVSDISLTLERFSIPMERLDLKALQEICSEINGIIASNTGLNQVYRYKIAEGTAPVPGLDAWVKFDFPRPQRVTLREDGSADFRNINRYVHVKEGERVATLFEGKPGEPGLDIYGKVIHPPAIKKIKLVVGKNVESRSGMDTENPELPVTHFFAASSGVIYTTDNSITVSPELNIESDVGLETGNINFDGTVRVQGNIVEGSVLKCNGSLFVAGNIETLDVEVFENLEIKGGVKGKDKDKGVIRVEGDFHAKFIENATIEVAGDLIVENYILNSKILCLGSVFVTSDNGSVIASEMIVYKGVSTANLGSNAQLDTNIEIGFHFRNDRLFKQGKQTIKELEEEVAELEPKILRIKEMVTRSRGKLDEAKKAEFKKIFEEYAKKKKTIEILNQKLEVIRMNRYNQENVKMVVRQAAYPSSVIKYRKQIEKFTTQASSFMLSFFPNQEKAIPVAWKSGPGK